MRNQKQNARLQQARGQLFICGMFGNCAASSVLSPRTPPASGQPESGDCPAAGASFAWATGNKNDHESLAAQITPEILLQHSHGHRGRSSSQREPLVVPGSPSTSASDAGDCTASSSSVTDARSSVASELSTTSASDLEELLAEIKAGNLTKMTISSLNNKLRGKSDCDASRELLRSSGVAAALVSLLLSSDLAVTDGAGARDSVDERHVPHVLEEALTALTALVELDDSAVGDMASEEFLAVVLWYVRKGRKEARENACLLLEKLSLEEGFKGTMGATGGVMEALNELLHDEKYLKLVKLATRTMLALCLLRGNRRRAVDADAVASLLELLPRARSATAEKALATLELLATSDEGRAALTEHALAVPILVELILKVSDRGTEYAAGTLHAMCGDSQLMRESAVAHGAPTKLLLLIQSDCTARAKRKASQLLKSLHKLWVEGGCADPEGEARTQAIRY